MDVAEELPGSGQSLVIVCALEDRDRARRQVGDLGLPRLGRGIRPQGRELEPCEQVAALDRNREHGFRTLELPRLDQGVGELRQQVEPVPIEVCSAAEQVRGGGHVPAGTGA